MNDITQLNALYDISMFAGHNNNIEYNPNRQLIEGLLFVLYGNQILRRSAIYSISKRTRGQYGRFDRWRTINKLIKAY